MAAKQFKAVLGGKEIAVTLGDKITVDIPDGTVWPHAAQDRAFPTATVTFSRDDVAVVNSELVPDHSHIFKQLDGGAVQVLPHGALLERDAFSLFHSEAVSILEIAVDALKRVQANNPDECKPYERMIRDLVSNFGKNDNSVETDGSPVQQESVVSASADDTGAPLDIRPRALLENASLLPNSKEVSTGAITVARLNQPPAHAIAAGSSS